MEDTYCLVLVQAGRVCVIGECLLALADDGDKAITAGRKKCIIYVRMRINIITDKGDYYH
jgi:hypothetical protein